MADLNPNVNLQPLLEKVREKNVCVVIILRGETEEFIMMKTQVKLGINVIRSPKQDYQWHHKRANVFQIKMSLCKSHSHKT